MRGCAQQWRRRRAPSSNYARYVANLQRAPPSPVGNVMRLAEEESLLCVVADWRRHAARGWIIAVTRSCRTATSCCSHNSSCCYASLPNDDGMQHFANYAVNHKSANRQQYDECQYTLSICLLFVLASHIISRVSFGFRQRRLRHNRKQAAFLG